MHRSRGATTRLGRHKRDATSRRGSARPRGGRTRIGQLAIAVLEDVGFKGASDNSEHAEKSK
jgi:hypothetical protein